ncbi:endonuclease-reverse transcriptase, partial [Lasius niger]
MGGGSNDGDMGKRERVGEGQRRITEGIYLEGADGEEKEQKEKSKGRDADGGEEGRGIEGRVVRGERGRRIEQEESELEREEVRRVISGLRERKAIGKDGIPNEVWKYGGEEVERWAWERYNRVWKGEGWPEEWKESVIIPIVKKGRGDEIKEYRKVTLMPSLYKIYTAVLGARLRREIEEKGVLAGSQARFKRGMGTVDQIYALNYIVNRQ